MNKKQTNPLLEKKIVDNCALSFDDVLLVPGYSDVTVDMVNPTTYITKKIRLYNPIMSACMDTISSRDMCVAMALAGGVGVVHKNLSPEEQVQMVDDVKNYSYTPNPDIPPTVDGNNQLMVGAAVGLEKEPYYNVQSLVNAGVDFIVIDSAHAHSKNIIEFLKGIKKLFPDLDTIVGNIVSAHAAHDLIMAGADCLKIGIGCGSICTTRIVGGIGVPQLTAIANVVNVAQNYNIPTIADGAIKNSGDIVKALAMGASGVMVGSLLSGTDQAPGSVVEQNGMKYKKYMGMGSAQAMSKGSYERYAYQKSSKFVPEGIETWVPYKGDVTKILLNLLGGVKVGMGYVGAKNILELYQKGKFVIMTNAGYQESLPHILLRKHKYQF